MAEKWFSTTVMFAVACTWSATSPPTVFPQSMKWFIYAQSCHLLVGNSYCVPQNTHNMYTMWHSIKYTYQSKDSMKISLSAPLLSALGRTLSLKLFTVFVLILHIRWAAFVSQKQKQQEKSLHISWSNICRKSEHFSGSFSFQNVYKILETVRTFSPLA